MWLRIGNKAILAYLIGTAALLLGACSGTSLEMKPSITPDLATVSTERETKTPSPTLTKVPTFTATKTETQTPSPSPTPSENLSFYETIACLPKNTARENGTVTDIVDGDTIEVQMKDGEVFTIRYIGIDAAESGYPFFEAGKQANAELVFQKEVVLIKDQSETDPYQRWLRYVIVDGVFVNLELVREGFAKAVNYPPDEACKDAFTAAEEEARQAFRGMWTATQTPEPLAGKVIILAVNKREEWVDIQNVGAIDVDLTGWKLVSERGHQDCPLSGVLKSGEVLRIWSMQAQGAGLSCGYASPIWNNSEPDPAVLYDAQGNEVSRK